MSAVINDKIAGQKVQVWERCFKLEGAWAPVVGGKCYECGEVVAVS